MHCSGSQPWKPEVEEELPLVNNVAMNFFKGVPITHHEEADDEKKNYEPGMIASFPAVAREDLGDVDDTGFRVVNESYSFDSLSGDVDKVVPENTLNMLSPCRSLILGDEPMIDNRKNITNEPTLAMELKRLASFLDLEDEWREL